MFTRKDIQIFKDRQLVLGILISLPLFHNFFRLKAISVSVIAAPNNITHFNSGLS